MDEIETTGGLSRRTMIKRAGIGAAVVWAAPTLTSVGLSSAAGTVAPCDCPPGFCASAVDCTADGSFCVDIPCCLCIRSTVQDCHCGDTRFGNNCGAYPACGPNGECPGSSECVPGCCGGNGICLTPCGTAPAGAAASWPYGTGTPGRTILS